MSEKKGPEIIRGKSKRGRKTVIYGGPGLGKSTMASQSPGAVFVPTEDGLADIDCAHYPVAKRLDEFEANLAHLAKNMDGVKTVIIDSGDWLERLIHAHLCAEDSVSDIAAYGKGYGRGYKASLSRFETILRKLDYFISQDVNVCFVCHDRVVEVHHPEHGDYSQTTLRMHDLLRDCLIEWADDVLFITPKINVDEESGRATSGSVRVVKTSYHPAYRAKHRGTFPSEIAIPHPSKGNAWEAYFQYVGKEVNGASG